MSQLYYGDNLEVLREHVADESVDLIYLDPPFNSNANYNILFKSPKGAVADSQIEAFEDTWHYGPEAAQAFHEVMTSGNTDVANLLRSMQEFLGQNDMMAYLAMMAARLIHLHRVLKPTGSLYLHCDPTASHYLKLLLDGVFGADQFRSEIIWKRTSAHNSAKRWGPIHDVILFYTKSNAYIWNRTFTAYDASYVQRYYRHEDAAGQRYRLSDLTASGTRNGESGQPWNGFDPTAHGRHWAIPGIIKEMFPDAPPETKTLGWLDLLAKHGLVAMTGEGTGWPHFKRYLDKMEGQSPQDIIDDIPPLSQRHAERLGYPTQKPLMLLERIIAASSNEGDVVLDPFCGCGTAVHAAQKLNRRWIGIDLTYLAIGLIERRLREAFPGIAFETVGEPKGLMDAQHLAASEPYQFQYWITQKIGGQPYQGGRKGADRGIDGYIYYTRNEVAHGKSSTSAAIVSVKAGRNIGVAMVRDLKGVIDREKADIGIFVCVANPSREMEREAAAAGIWTDPVTGMPYPRLQLFTLAELFQGRQPQVPLLDRQTGYRRARAEDSGKQGMLL